MLGGICHSTKDGTGAKFSTTKSILFLLYLMYLVSSFENVKPGIQIHSKLVEIKYNDRRLYHNNIL